MGTLATWLRDVLHPLVASESPVALGRVSKQVAHEPWPQPPTDAIGLFLEIDEVLLLAEDGSFVRMAQLVALLQRFPQLFLVLLPSWRLHASRSQLLSCFPDEIHGRVIGVTPFLPALWPPLRERECQAFAHRAGLARFVAVAEDASGYSEGCSFLVRTDRAIGLDDEAVSRVDARLRALGAIAA